VRTVLKYTDIYTLSSSAGVAAYSYSGNSAYDPDITGGGGQPYYWDRYSGIYTKYVVLNATMTLRFNVDTGSNQGVAAVVAPVYLNSFPSSITGLEEAIEYPFSKTRLLINAPV